MNSQIKLLLSHNDIEQQFLELKIDIYSHSLAQKFFKEFKRIVAQDYFGSSKWTHIQKNYSFLGWPNSNRNLLFLCQEVDRYIKMINTFSINEGWAQYSENYYIDVLFDEINLGGLNEACKVSQEKLNKLHSKFEKMMGQVWARSEFFIDADDDIRFALIQINHLCHEMEAFIRSQNFLSPITQVSFLEPTRIELNTEDDKYFSLTPKFGQVVLHYCQTSKTYWDAFYDNDNFVEEDNINCLKYYSGEFDILWNKTPGLVLCENSFNKWLEHQGINSLEKKNRVGHALIGEVDLSIFGQKKHEEILSILGNYLNICEISILEDNLGSSLEKRIKVPYNWKDSNYMKKQLELFCHE